ncbi:MAG: hypothetical protein RBT82_12480 [Desulfomonilia bacterium]|jgi:hypothetical protein|nr:hypothetical protein [Desulfomonilia bacterium]
MTLNFPAIKSFWDQDFLSWCFLVIASLCAGVAIGFGLCVDGVSLKMAATCILAYVALGLLALYLHRRARVALRNGTGFSSFSALLEAEGGEAR